MAAGNGGYADMSNLFVSFEFNRPDRTYDRVVHAISMLGESWTEIHYAHWHVKTELSARQACDRLKSLLDQKDKLVVVDATNNAVAWVHLDAAADARLRAQGFA
jgi:hypothetical protein